MEMNFSDFLVFLLLPDYQPLDQPPAFNFIDSRMTFSWSKSASKRRKKVRNTLPKGRILEYSTERLPATGSTCDFLDKSASIKR